MENGGSDKGFDSSTPLQPNFLKLLYINHQPEICVENKVISF